MTIVFPDVSEYHGAFNFAPYPLGVARASISNVKDKQWDANVGNAVANGKRLAAYAFLNAPSLGVSVNAQADFAFGIVGQRPCMLDIEPNRGACASFADVMTWITRYRSLGGVVNLCYLPRWSWSGNMGSPSLVPLTQAGVWSSGEQLHHLFGYRTWLGGVRWCVSYSVAVHRQPQRYWRRWQRIQGYRRSMVGHDERYGSADTKG